MSVPLSFQSSSLGHDRRRPFTQDLYRKPTATSSYRYDAYSAFSSSPPGSSSPPRTPYSTGHAYGYADIRSSPQIPVDVFRGVGEHIEDQSSWSRYSAREPIKYSASAYTRGPYNTTYLPDHDYPPRSNFDVSTFSEDVSHDVPDLDSEPASDSAPASSVVFTDSEEEEEKEEEDGDSHGFSFGSEGFRTTFFRTSAERGQWKSNPMAYRPAASLLPTRKSAPTESRVATPTLFVNPTRPISEPAPSTTSASTPDFLSSEKQDLPDRATEATTWNSGNSIPIIPPTDEDVESPHTLPSLSDDRESSVDVDDHDLPSSPLPSSSPPMSPTSITVGMLSRSVSPVSLAYDAFSMRSSSPLSELPDDDEDLEEIGDSLGNSDVSDAKNAIPSHAAKVSPLSINSLLSPKPTTAPPIPSTSENLTTSNDVLPPAPGPSSSANEGPATDAIPDSATPHEIPLPADGTAPLLSPSVPSSSAPVEEITKVPNCDRIAIQDPVQDESIEKVQSAALRDKNGVDRPSHEVPTSSLTKEKRKKDQSTEGPARKKQKTITDGDVATSSASTSKTAPNRKRTEEEENVDIDSVAESAAPAIPKSRRKKRTGDDADAPCTSTKRVAKSRRSKARASSVYQDSDAEMEPVIPEAPLDAETAALHAQVCGMLIETMAMSRASSLPVSSLYKMVTQDQPALKTQRTEKEWIRLFDQVLHRGEAGRGSGVFGKVESSGKDDSNRPLEAQWFYVPELDEDQERATLIKAMMPRPAKRSETKKYKQYYWQPLGKISKWDPEDEL